MDPLELPEVLAEAHPQGLSPELNKVAMGPSVWPSDCLLAGARRGPTGARRLQLGSGTWMQAQTAWNPYLGCC